MKVRSEIKRPSQLQEHWKGNFASKDQAVFEDHLIWELAPLHEPK
jgi:hypothetical protein